MGASIRFKNTENFSHIKSQMLQTDGILQMIKMIHSIYVATHKQLYEYFPTDIEKVKHTGEYHNLAFCAHVLHMRIKLFCLYLEQNCLDPFQQWKLQPINHPFKSYNLFHKI